MRASTNYARPADCFSPKPTPRPVPPGDAQTDYSIARFVVDVAEGRRPLPLVTETLPFAEAIRRQLGFEYARIVRKRHKGSELPRDDPRLFSPIIYGKDEQGVAAKSHDHAFYLPSDEDRDGRIDHITIYAAGRFSRDVVSALDRLRSLSFGKEGEADDGRGGGRRTTHRLLLVGLDRFDRPKPTTVSLFRSATVWISSTPYIAFRHRKQRGKNRDHRDFIPSEALPAFLKHVFGEDWSQRADLRQLPIPEVEFVSDPQKAFGWRFRSLQFRRARNRPGDDGYSRPFGTFRLTFSTPVTGPLCLGYACHFGMGLFVPEPVGCR